MSAWARLHCRLYGLKFAQVKYNLKPTGNMGLDKNDNEIYFIFFAWKLNFCILIFSLLIFEHWTWLKSFNYFSFHVFMEILMIWMSNTTIYEFAYWKKHFEIRRWKIGRKHALWFINLRKLWSQIHHSLWKKFEANVEDRKLYLNNKK